MFKIHRIIPVAVGGALALSLCSVQAASYYVDSVLGNDSNSGTSSNTAWQSLSKVNATTFSAGDLLLLKSGGNFSGTFWPKGSGSTNNAITVNSYGGSTKPIIDGGGATDAVFLLNQEFWEFNNLEVINNAVSDAERRGFHIAGSNYVNTVINHIHIKNCSIHNIRGTLSTNDTDVIPKRTGGIIVEVLDDTPTATRFNDILIEGNTIASVRNQGIVAAGNRSGQNDFPGSGAWNARKVSNLIIRSNTISDVTKNALILRLADSTCLVERNVCYDTATLDTGNTMFTAACDGVVFQYNEGYRNLAGDHDGSLYDADLRSVNIVFQYSYSHDNSHGLFWNYPSASGANSNIIVRYNISRNDGGNIFSFSGDSVATATTYIYNNVVYLPAGATNLIFDDRSATHTVFAWNNIFYSLSSNIVYDLGSITAAFDYNVYYGEHPASEPVDAHKLTSNPLFVAPGTGTNGISTLNGYQLQSGSPCIDSGTNISGNGAFDFFNNTVPFNFTTDRGANELHSSAPAITQQPANIMAIVGANVSLSVTTSGTQPFSYQWFKNGAPVSGATNSTLALASVATNDTGSFSVTVTNIVGAVTSAVAVLVVADPNNYIPPRFSAVTATSGVNFTTVTNFYNTVQTLALDVYQPTGDTSSNRPAVMWIHGGGLRTGSSKTQSYIVTYSQEFAKRGYVCFSIEYRLRNGADMPTGELELPALQDAAHDANTALAWIRNNAAAYKVNTNFLFVGGGSAGGMTGCVLDFHEGPDTNICASCSSASTVNAPNNQYPFTDWNRSGVIAFADLWGSPELPKRWYVIDSNDVPTTIIHGTADTTVPYTNSSALADSMQAAGVNYYLNPIAGANHTPTSFNSTIIPWVANFFAREWNKKFCGAAGVDTLTQSATAVGQNSATLNGRLISANASGTYYFRYGTTTNYTAATPTNTVVASLSACNVTATLSSLATNTLYHFALVMSNAAGVKTSADATFTTIASGNSPPSITAQPQAQTGCNGGTISFNVTVGGTSPLNYQWLKAGANISDATNSTLNLSSMTTNDAANYSVVITNVAGAVTSSVAALMVNLPVSAISQPQSRTNSAGTSATFTIAATGTAPLAYQWRKGGTNIAVATNASYTNASVALADSGNYDVVVSNACGSVTSSVAVLTVTAAPTITAHPSSATKNVGASAIFIVTATGSPPLVFQWRFNGTDIAGATNSTQTMANVTTNDSGIYSVVVTNAYGTATSSNATLTVNSGTVSNGILAFQGFEPGDSWSYTSNIPAGTFAGVSTNAGGGDTPAGQRIRTGTNSWQVNNLSSLTSPSVLTFSNVITTGYTNLVVTVHASATALLSTAGVENTDFVKLYVAVNSAAFPASPDIFLRGNSNARWGYDASIITNAIAGTAITLTSPQSGVTSTNNYSTLTVNMPANVVITNVAIKLEIANDGTSELWNVDDIALTGSTPSVTSDPPLITTQPQAQAVCTGNNASFAVIASGTAPLNYQWLKAGAVIANATNSTLNLSAVTIGDAANYSVIITNGAGELTSPVVALTVNVAPSISAQPQSRTNDVGTGATLSVTAAGTSPLTYQWRKGGVSISGATSSAYTNNSVFAADGGNYDVVITNGCGAITSSVATLAVNELASSFSLLSSQNPAAFLASLSFTTTFSGGAGTPTGTVQFKTNGANFGSVILLSSGAAASSSTASLPRGTNIISAEYSGDVNYLSQTNFLSQVVTNRPPVVNTVIYVRQPGQTVNIALSNLATNWSDADGDALALDSVSLTTNHVTLTTNATTITYASANGQNDRFNYVVRDAFGETTSGTVLLSIVTPPAITAQPQSITTNSDSAVTFSFVATGTAPLAYQWTFAGTNIPNATNPSYTIASVGTGNVGNYSVIVSNAFGVVTSSIAALNVTIGSGGGGGNSIVIAEVYNGGGKTGADYNRDYVVLKNVSGSSISLTNWSLQHDKAGVWQTPFVLTNYTIPAGGHFLIQCYYDGGTAAGAALSPDATAPQSSVWNLSTSAGGAVALVNITNALQSCSSNSVVDLVGFVASAGNCYEGAGVASGGSATQSNLRASSGCQDSNDNTADFSLGTPTPRNLSSSNVQCCVSPVVVVNPLSQSITVGGSATFTVAVFGSATLTYQWRKGGANLIGETNNAITVTANTAADAGNFDVVIANGCGALTSSVAVLTVTKATPGFSLISSLNPAGFHSAVAFSATLSGGGASPTGTVQFKTNGVELGGAISFSGGLAIDAGVTNLPRGTITVAAEYSGDSNYFGLTNTLYQIVTNKIPVANPVVYRRPAGQPWTIAISALATNWSDEDGDILVIDHVNLGTTNGVVLETNAASITYVSTNLVDDVFTYVIRDVQGGIATGRVILHVVAGRAQALNMISAGPVITAIFRGTPGFDYVAQFSYNLNGWTDIAVLTAGSDGTFHFVDDYSDVEPVPMRSFYRLVIP